MCQLHVFLLRIDSPNLLKQKGRFLESCFLRQSLQQRGLRDPGHLILLWIAIRQKKKKAAITEGRPTNVEVVVMPKLLPAIPKGVRRSQMCKGGRIKSLLFKRSMTCSEVQSVVRRGFSHLGLEKWKYLESSRNNILSVSECQEIDGGVVVARKGCLYICEEIRMVWCSSLFMYNVHVYTARLKWQL